MKKLLVMFLTMAMVVSLAACGQKNETTESSESNAVESESTATESEVVEESTESEVVETETTPTEEAGDDVTMGQSVLAAFQELMAENPEMTGQEIADAILAREDIIPFAGLSMPQEPGFLMGFDAEISGFEEAIQFSPMIGTIPFMGFIFTLADDADVDAFVKQLEDNANPAWNICTEADETIIEANGNKVFFLMSPKSADM